MAAIEDNADPKGRRISDPGRGWPKVLAASLLLLLTACATPGAGDGSGRTIAMPDDWNQIDIGEADLNLPLNSPFEINELRERVGGHQLFENLYTFHGLSGFVVTSRVFFGQFADNPAREVKDRQHFLRYARSLPLVERRKLKVGTPRVFRHPELRSSGFYAKALSELRHEDCFIVRIGYLLVDYNSFESEPGDIDTIVYGLLCSDRLDEAALLTLLTELQVVRDRENFRKALSKRGIGTI